jgi:histidine phosphotransferase ChpT
MAKARAVAAAKPGTNAGVVSGGAPLNGGSLWVAECLCARLCHDLAGGLGALMGSVELARDDEAMAREAMQLASFAGQALVARLKLLRAAWVGEDRPLDLARLAELGHGLADRRITLDLEGLPPATMFAPPVDRIVLNLVLLGAEALPAGGAIWLEMTERDRARGLLLGIAGPRAEWPPGLAAALAGEAVIEGPSVLQAPLTVLLVRAAGLRLSLLMPTGLVPAAGEPAAARTPFLLLRLPAGVRFP